MWSTNAIILLRNIINDTVEPYTYTDERLLLLLLTAAYINVQLIAHSVDYTVDINAQTISPEPTDIFVALMILKAAVILAESEWKTESRKAMVIRDGPTTIDAKAVVEQKAAYAKSLAAKFDKSVAAYQIGNYTVGTAIVGAYNYGSAYTSLERFY